MARVLPESDSFAFRYDKRPDGRRLDPIEREKVLRPYLPKPRPQQKGSDGSKTPGAATSAKGSSSKGGRLGVRALLVTLVHKFIFFSIQLVFSFYIRMRQTYHAVIAQIFSVMYYHHRSPELIQRDVKGLSRLPNHLSVIVELQGSGEEALGKLVEDVSEVAAWCACAGIPMLSVYEQTGILKQHMPSLQSALTKTLNSYFPPTSMPSLSLRAPHHPSWVPTTSPTPDPSSSSPPSKGLQILLLSASDGRATLVDLTKTLAEMSQRGKLSPDDISPELIDAELTESSCSEPDLLIVMAPSAYRARPRRRRSSQRRRSSGASSSRGRRSSGSLKAGADVNGDGQYAVNGDAAAPSPSSSASDYVPVPGGEVCLRGYPPWQVRLTEIFHVQDNAGVGYQVFLRGLYRFAKAQMRLGR